MATGQATTVEFTAADLNALLDRDPDFSAVRGRARIDIANSIMTITLSAPLDDIPWARLRRRWFNASAAFGFAYAFGMFRVDLKSAEANGQPMGFQDPVITRAHDAVPLMMVGPSSQAGSRTGTTSVSTGRSSRGRLSSSARV